MTGKEIIDYISKNNLEDCEFLTDIKEVALRLNVGTATIKALVANGSIAHSELYLLPGKEE